jgi:hypothetical protein
VAPTTPHKKIVTARPERTAGRRKTRRDPKTCFMGNTSVCFARSDMPCAAIDGELPALCYKYKKQMRLLAFNAP